MLNQKTIAKPIQTVGIGLHSGNKSNLYLKPAPVDSGIVFIRIDQEPQTFIPAKAENVTDTRLASVLQIGSHRISTVEHLMSACAGLGIDNLIVEIDGEEIPIMDGSAASFLFLLQSAGFEEQSRPRQFIQINQLVEVIDGDKLARLEPFWGFKLDFTIDFKHTALDKTGKH